MAFILLMDSRGKPVNHNLVELGFASADSNPRNRNPSPRFVLTFDAIESRVITRAL